MAQSDTKSTVGLDGLFSVLSDETRRHVLTTIAECSPREASEFTPDELRSDENAAQRFESELYHRHLPRLDAAGVVSWDREADAIRRGPNFEEIRPLIELVSEREDEPASEWP
ncbi:DUF7344 domain-containing protein [Halorientalis halophila]|uniref:DUF7344 domain-containing protein n=1 Tax=Halorientalis halophila TaxID=3108499 RepID=UPI00300A50E2